VPLVLASNDANSGSKYAWKDLTGVHYHFPNNYRNVIKPGERFVYYRGVRRLGGRRGVAEYFGHGIVGRIWRDPEIAEDAPKSRWAWYCAVDQYRPFGVPVPAKIDGTFFENIRRNKWRDGVRLLSEDVYLRLLAAADGFPAGTISQVEVPSLPPFSSVVLPDRISTGLLKPTAGGDDDNGASSSASSGTKRSRTSKLAGDRAEEIVFNWLKKLYGPTANVRWLANEGLTPGWDMQFAHNSGETIAVEVKGTTLASFSNFELTANELEAMRRLKEGYWLVLVAKCASENPAIEVLANPASNLSGGVLSLAPTRWRVTMQKTEAAGTGSGMDVRGASEFSPSVV